MVDYLHFIFLPFNDVITGFLFQVLYTVKGEPTASVTAERADELNELTRDSQWSVGATPFSALVSKSREKIEKKMKEDVRNKEMSYTSPNTLIKVNYLMDRN